MQVRASHRIELIDKIARELQSRYGYSEIDSFLASFGIAAPKGPIGTNSKWVYSKAALRSASNSVLADIAADLELPSFPAVRAGLAPRVWRDTSGFKLFVSHVSSAKEKAMRLKSCLSPYNVHAFVAHEDIEPDVEWQREIESALWSMDALLAICTSGFAASTWTQQEVGFALGRGCKVVALKMGEAPTGFTSNVQALLRGNKRAEDVARELVAILETDPLTENRIKSVQSSSTSLQPDLAEIPF